jgi:peptide/nickel transport system permease protein
MTTTTTTVKRPGATRSPALRRYLRAFQTPKGVIGLSIVAVLGLSALFAPLIFPGGSDAQSRDALLGMSAAHPFGTDEFGRDLLARSVFGLRVDLSIILTAVPLSMVLGTLLGLSGALSDRLGEIVQRALDVIVGFPGLILGICIVVVLGAGWFPIFLTIVICGLPSAGRLSRAVLLRERDREHVLAARVLGVPKWKILLRHIAPFTLESMLVNSAVWMVVGVYIGAGLSIVGLGVQPPTPSLGVLLNGGMRYIYQAPNYVLFPALVLVLIAVAFGFIADALNETANKR